MENLEGANLNDVQQKRDINKELERQRRKEMANLYASLRSQLPLEYIKGKRSISDHAHQAVNYIKHLEKNIKELQFNRERMKKMTHSGALPHTSQCSNNNFENCVRVSTCNDHSLEILINSGFKEEGFMLSRVLEVLLEQGLDVLTCTCTTINDMQLHMIKTEVCGTTIFDPTKLQDKLRHIVHGNLGHI